LPRRRGADGALGFAVLRPPDMQHRIAA
jgi:hypothetical protein